MNYTVEDIESILQIKSICNIAHKSLLRFPEIDSRHILFPSDTLFFAFKGKHLDGHSFIPELIKQGVHVFIVDADFECNTLPACFFKTENVMSTLQQLAIHHRKKFNIPVIGITGSNGKTIVKEWLAQILSVKYKICKTPKSYNSQIGAALSILELNDSHDIGIFEAGISKQGEMQMLQKIIQPTLGIFTNIGDAHSVGFENQSAKLTEKLMLFSDANTIVYNSGEKELSTIVINKPNYKSWGNAEQDNLYIQSKEIIDGKIQLKLVFNKNLISFHLPFKDEASVENVLHCIHTALLFGIDNDLIQAQLLHLHGLSMRLEQIQGLYNCILINDSYSLDIKSLNLAIDFVEQQNNELLRTIVITDFEQQADDEIYKLVAYILKKHKFTKVIAIGKRIRSISAYLSNNITLHHFDDTHLFLKNIDELKFDNELILIKGARSFQLEKFIQEFTISKHDTILEIDLKALSHNINIYTSLLKPETKIMAVVKAASYGSGQYEIAKFIQHKNLDYLAVAYPDEGIILREKGIQLPILVMNIGSCDFQTLIDYRLEPEIFSMHQCQKLIYELGPFTPISIHLKIDSGMHRLGFQMSEIDHLCEWLKKYPHVKINSIFTHLSASDNLVFEKFTRNQELIFKEAANKIIDSINYKPLLHVLNSGGIAMYPEFQYDMVRLGIGMYGFDNHATIGKQLEKVHSLKAKITQIKNVSASDYISYNLSGHLNKNGSIGILSLGYADGLPRISGLRGYSFYLQDKKVNIVGVVCMDMCMIDLSEVDNAYEGMEVEIFGKVNALENLSELTDTIPYEILCGISSRVKRLFLQD